MADERDEQTGLIDVREAGRKGGRCTAKRHGHEHYVRIGRKGGQRLRQLIAAGRNVELKQQEA